jgi:hypothetical protein
MLEIKNCKSVMPRSRFHSAEQHVALPARFAVLEPTIKDLEKKHMAETVMGPVTFDDFVLEQGTILPLCLLTYRYLPFRNNIIGVPGTQRTVPAGLTKQ